MTKTLKKERSGTITRRPIPGLSIRAIVVAVVMAVIVASIVTLWAIEGSTEPAGEASVIPSERPAAADLSRSQATDAARLEGLAGFYAVPQVGPDGLTATQRVEAERWTQLAATFGLTSGQVADAARWAGLAQAYRPYRPSPVDLAESARLTALADWLVARLPGPDGLTAIQRVEAARWQGLADQHR